MQTDAAAPGDLGWRGVRRAIDGRATRLLRNALRHFGEHAIDAAWADFNLLEAHEKFDQDTQQMQVFMPWFLYDRLPDPHHTALPAAQATCSTAGWCRSKLWRCSPVLIPPVDKPRVIEPRRAIVAGGAVAHSVARDRHEYRTSSRGANRMARSLRTSRTSRSGAWSVKSGGATARSCARTEL